MLGWDGERGEEESERDKLHVRQTTHPITCREQACPQLVEVMGRERAVLLAAVVVPPRRRRLGEVGREALSQFYCFGARI